MKRKLSTIWLLGSIFGSNLLSTVNINAINAQVISDRSLSTSVTSTDGANFIIDGGELRGNNLFHSFQEFSIPTGGAAIFTNDLNIVNIFSRVTGNNISQIDGAIAANGTANLFLINPNGIIFGKNASLDLGGSFFATTANKIVFADGTEFSAIEGSSTTPLLTISTPIGLQLGQNPQPITIATNGNEGKGLTVRDDRTLGLIGGNITLEDAILNAPLGRIELASFGDGRVALVPQGLGWRLGEIETINGKEIQILAGSSLYNSNFSQNSDNSNTGIQIQGGKVIINDSQVTSSAFDRSNGGTIDIFVSQLVLESGGKIQSTNFGSGKGGAIEIETNKLEISSLSPNNSKIPCFCSNASQIASETKGEGNGGNIWVTTTELSLNEGGQISSTVSLEATGRGGDLLVNVADKLTVTGINPEIDIFPSAIVSYSFGKGNGGDINVNFNDGIFRDGGSILSLTQGEGKGGDLVANSTGDIFATGVSFRFPFLTSGISSFNLGAGDGGNVSVTSERLHLENGASVLSFVFIQSDGVPIFDAGTGDGGDVNVVAAKSIDIIGVNPILTNISTNLGSFTLGSGDTGDVTVTTENLRLSEGAQLATIVALSISTLGEPIFNSGRGNGGNLTVNASESIEIVGIEPFLFTPSIIATLTAGFGDAGDGIINTRRLIVSDGANIGSLTTVTGDAGKFTIKASESISVSGVNRFNSTNGDSVYGVIASINSNALIVNEALRQLFFLPPFPTGNTGELTIETGKLSIFDGGRISVQHQGTGNAGTLTINADSISIENGGSISATTTLGIGLSKQNK
jgi:filamentous hemagglutinin family protein